MEHTDIEQLIAGPLGELGLMAEDVALHSAGVHRRLVITVDLAGDTAEPISADAVAQATRAISEVIDPLPLFGDRPYDLEVSSPGAQRPLTQPRHFRRNLGRTLEVKHAGHKTTGRLAAVTETDIVLEPGSGRAAQDIAFADITAAKAVLKFR